MTDNAQDHLSPIRRQGVHRQVGRLPLPRAPGLRGAVLCLGGRVVGEAKVVHRDHQRSGRPDYGHVARRSSRSPSNWPPCCGPRPTRPPIGAVCRRPDDIEEAVLLMAQGGQFYCGNGNSSTWSLDKCAAPAQAIALRLGRLVPAGAAGRQSGPRCRTLARRWTHGHRAGLQDRPGHFDLRRSAVCRPRRRSTATGSTTRRWSSC